MASRAILKRRRFTDFYYANTCARSILSSHLHAVGVENTLQTSPLNAPSNFNFKHYERISLPLPREASFSLSALAHYRQSCYEMTKFVPSDIRLAPNAVTSVRCLSLQSTCSFSTAAAKQPELGNDEVVAKKRKEASPEECDQAVEGLSTVKAKAKAKRLQEPQSVVQTFMKRLWALIVGIGPAIRAVASMSRLGSFVYVTSLA